MVRERTFIHPVERFRFDVPRGFSIINGMDAVLVRGPQKSIAKFDEATKNQNLAIDTYLARVWAAGVAISPVQRFSIGGLAAAGADTQIGAYDARLIAIDSGQGKVYRFLLGVPQQGAGRNYSSALEGIAKSFRRISATEAARIKPLRIRVVRVGQGDSMASLAARMDFSDHRIERFRALNGLPAGAVLQPGREVKIVTQ
jgi:predicted Zn-dependent protease